jgi:hypothetical protein
VESDGFRGDLCADAELNEQWRARGEDLILHRSPLQTVSFVALMTFKLLIVAGGLLALAAAGIAVHFRRSRSPRITSDHLSGDWLAQARAREDQP